MKKSLRMLMSMLLTAVCASGVSAATVTDELTLDLTGVTGTSYVSWSDVTATSDAVYAGQSAGGNSSIQLRSNNNNSGVITTESGGKARKVTVTWQSNTTAGRTLNVYGKSSAYSAPTDLYGNNAGTLIGTIVCGTSTSLEISDDYAYIGFRSASGAMYLEKVEIEWETTGGSSNPVDPTVTFESETLEISVGESATNTLSYPSSLTVTYSSSNPEVATVDSESGMVLGVSEGEVTITASWEAVSGRYNSGSAEYTLTVNPAGSTPTYVKVSGIDALTPSDVFIIVGTKSDDTSYAMSNDKGTNSAPTAVSVTITDDKIITDATNILWNISKGSSGETTTYTFKVNGSTDALYCTNANNGLRVGTSETNTFTLEDNGYLMNTTQNRYVGVYNTQDWRSYTNTTGNIADQTFAFYKLESDAPVDEREEAGLAYAVGSFELEEGAEPFTNELTNPNGLDVTYSSTNESVATVDETGLVTIVGIGTTSIKADFAGDDNYFSGSASYTVTVTSAPYTSIAELQAAATLTSTPIRVTFTNVQVTAVSGTSNAYICDEAGNGALIYSSTSGHGLSAGQILNGTLSCNLVLYKGQTELTGFSSTDLTISDGELEPTEMSIGEITSANQSRYVHLEKVKYVADGKKFVDDLGDEIAYYDTFKTNATLEDGMYYNIDGIVILFNTTLEFAPLTSESIEPYTDEAMVIFMNDELVVNLYDYTANDIEVYPEELVYTYSTDGEDVIEFDEENPGYFWANGEGTYTIFASWDEQVIDGITYLAGQTSFTVVVQEEEPIMTDLLIDEDNAYIADADFYDFVYLTRSFKADQINTLVLPLDIPEEEAKYVFGEDIVIYELVGIKTSEQGNSSLSFENVTSQGIRAGIPCLIKNVTPNDENVYTFEYHDVSYDIPEVYFESEEGLSVAFIGSYEPLEIEADDNTYVISNSKVYVVNTPVTMKGTRAYIYAPAANGAKVIGMEFSDGTTGIMDVATGTITTGKVYDMSGREVKTPTRGMYIIDGKKVLY